MLTPTLTVLTGAGSFWPCIATMTLAALTLARVCISLSSAILSMASGNADIAAGRICQPRDTAA